MPQQYQDKELLTNIIISIKEIRKQRGVTLETFYFETGIHLARIEHGKTNISISALAKICNYYNLSLTDFFELLES